MVFIETELFTETITALTNDEEYQELQNELLENPEAGDIIKGTGGVRKIRFGYGGKGKRGGGRAIYYYKIVDSKIYMLLAYPKSEKDDLTQKQKEVLKDLVKSELRKT
ncbi:type II toxin-antitoxin system RelE/ParE family toxin [Undibacterium sp.]|jgi:hypothetical protein|uniref:type II toxin-antitoxin system RelE/ParE family toxin n=1 Tax=Undibacterium sp. TaxID=1914977 RepID=UPI002C20DE43|nr:type II toxin-antitoxin system RelE/ParE family toxin [Undibacterium sp.]HTD06808.1 type II toxin-antitoxin system RelE/ParE family toxin [Undibacterium sp.]